MSSIVYAGPTKVAPLHHPNLLVRQPVQLIYQRVNLAVRGFNCALEAGAVRVPASDTGGFTRRCLICRRPRTPVFPAGVFIDAVLKTRVRVAVKCRTLLATRFRLYRLGLLLLDAGRVRSPSLNTLLLRRIFPDAKEPDLCFPTRTRLLG
jgi:hypothetical protein